MDIAALIGTIIGLGFILLGQALEGGNIGQLLQITAAFIVVGGTAGAVFLSFPIEDFKTAGKREFTSNYRVQVFRNKVYGKDIIYLQVCGYPYQEQVECVQGEMQKALERILACGRKDELWEKEFLQRLCKFSHCNTDNRQEKSRRENRKRKA